MKQLYSFVEIYTPKFTLENLTGSSIFINALYVKF